MVAAFGRRHADGTPIFVRPEEVAFSVDLEHATAPLATEIRKLKMRVAAGLGAGLMQAATPGPYHP